MRSCVVRLFRNHICLFLVAMALVLTACKTSNEIQGKISERPVPSSGDDEQARLSLSGEWSNECYSLGGMFAMSNRMVFTSDSEAHIGTTLYNNDCSQALFYMGSDVTYEVIEQVDEVAWKVNFTTKSTMVWTELNAVLDFNGNNYCGYNDWVTGVPKTVTQEECEAAGTITESQTGVIQYWLLGYDGTDVYTFDNMTGDTSAELTRPTGLLLDYPLTKQ